MSLRGLGPLCALLLMGAAAAWPQEPPSTPQPQPNAGQQSAPATTSTDSSSKPTTADQQQSPDDQATPQNTTKKPPSRLKRALNRAKPNCIAIEGRQTCSDNGQSKQTEDAQSRVPKNQPAPRSEPPPGESSSKDTQVDLSPPPDDMMHEGADDTGVTEFHSYDPHKAAKNVEVGDFYFKRGNYKAAESRYAEALDWKPNDAIATFKLAQSEEKLGKKDDALKNYQAYLKILPQGEFAVAAKDAIARLNK